MLLQTKRMRMKKDVWACKHPDSRWIEDQYFSLHCAPYVTMLDWNFLSSSVVQFSKWKLFGYYRLFGQPAILRTFHFLTLTEGERWQIKEWVVTRMYDKDTMNIASDHFIGNSYRKSAIYKIIETISHLLRCKTKGCTETK